MAEGSVIEFEWTVSFSVVPSLAVSSALSLLVAEEPSCLLFSFCFRKIYPLLSGFWLFEDVGVFCPPTLEVTVPSVSPAAIARLATIGPVCGIPAWL